MNASGESAREDEGDAGRLREEEGRERLDGLTKLAGGEGDMTLATYSVNVSGLAECRMGSRLRGAGVSGGELMTIIRAKFE
jgi:hypothetical protein